MPVSALWLNIDGESLVRDLEAAIESLNACGTELVLDFASVRRIDRAALGKLEELAGTAEKKGVKVVLSGVQVEIYRVLKLMRLAPHFSFSA